MDNILLTRYIAVALEFMLYRIIIIGVVASLFKVFIKNKEPLSKTIIQPINTLKEAFVAIMLFIVLEYGINILLALLLFREQEVIFSPQMEIVYNLGITISYVFILILA